MSNLWINLRLWYWHLQIGPDRPYVGLTFNRYRWARHLWRPWIELH